MCLLGDLLILFEFEDAFEAEKVLLLGPIMFEGRKLQLEWWRLDVGCFKEGACINEVWVRVLGLLVHLRGKDYFKRLRDVYRGFVKVDVEIEERCHLKWARLLIKSSGRKG